MSRVPHRMEQFVAVAGLTLVLLAPALWNRFPFMFYDTSAFITIGYRNVFFAERLPFYGWFLRASGMGVSVWLPVLAQAVITVLLLGECARVLAPRLAGSRFGLLVGALSIGTSLPWFVGQYMPDIFLSLMVLALYLLGFHAHALSWPRRAALVLLAAWSAASHATHLALAAGLVVLVAAMEAAAHKKKLSLGAARPRWRLPAVGLAAGLAMVLAVNYGYTRALFLNRAAPSFVLGQLIENGIAKRLLEDTCPGSGYQLCPYKDRLPSTAHDWLWGADSPFEELGRFEGTRVDSSRMIMGSFERYPWTSLTLLAGAAFEQFFLYPTGTGNIEPFTLVDRGGKALRVGDIWGQEEVLYPVFLEYMPGRANEYLGARQQANAIPFAVINDLHEPVVAISLLAAVAIVATAAWRKLWDTLVLPLFVLASLVGNALLCSAAGPHERYQSRLVWAIVFAVLLVAARHLPDGERFKDGAEAR